MTELYICITEILKFSRVIFHQCTITVIINTGQNLWDKNFSKVSRWQKLVKFFSWQVVIIGNVLKAGQVYTYLVEYVHKSCRPTGGSIHWDTDICRNLPSWCMYPVEYVYKSCRPTGGSIHWDTDIRRNLSSWCMCLVEYVHKSCHPTGGSIHCYIHICGNLPSWCMYDRIRHCHSHIHWYLLSENNIY